MQTIVNTVESRLTRVKGDGQFFYFTYRFQICQLQLLLLNPHTL